MDTVNGLTRRIVALGLVLLALLDLASCDAVGTPGSPTGSANLRVVATTTFLADLAQNVAGSRVKVSSLMPIGVDPHGFEPTPADVRTVASANVLITNGQNYELFLDKLLQNAGGKRLVVEASAGLTPRTPKEGETAEAGKNAPSEVDPHFWLDPVLAITYVQNIRDGLSSADPDGAAQYAANADVYIAKLKDLDAWIMEQVKQVPEARRLLVTNHESLGYFADRYGFRVVGAIVPGVSPEATPSAQQLSRLVQQIKQTGAPAIFLEVGTNPQLADQVAKEAGVRVVTDLYTESVSGPTGPAPTYVDMLKWDVNSIVNALK